ncbi:hypothetical protein GQ600_9383 [Phytophthora cactorum]|nr:hypothetical protein GQ600_9383 [Phytophthora cactorum]
MQHVIAVGSQPADPVEQGTDPIGQSSSAEVNGNDEEMVTCLNPLEVTGTVAGEMVCLRTPKYCHFGNDTNNRLEASWKQIKYVVNSCIQLDEWMASLMYYQSLAESDFVNRMFKVGVVHHAAYDSEMQYVSNLVSEYACSLIFERS